MKVFACSYVRYFSCLHHQIISVLSEDQDKSLMKRSLLKMSIYLLWQQTQSTSQKNLSKHILSKCMGVSQFAACFVFEVFPELLSLVHRVGRISSSLVVWEVAGEGLPAWLSSIQKTCARAYRAEWQREFPTPVDYSVSICTFIPDSTRAQTLSLQLLILAFLVLFLIQVLCMPILPDKFYARFQG